MPLNTALLLIFLPLALVACETEEVVSTQEGIASHYSSNLHKGPTASGEVYDHDKLTAAHRTLPFDTRVRVTHLKNGKSVTVRINDRGPFIEGRIIDLSGKAAEKIGLIGQGLAKVKVEVLGKREEETEQKATEGS